MSPGRFYRNIREFDGTKTDTYPEHVDFTLTEEERQAAASEEAATPDSGIMPATAGGAMVYFSGPDLHDFAWKIGERSASAAAKRIKREVAAMAISASVQG